jgi:hypothetical protein
MRYVVGFQFSKEGSRVALIKKNRPACQVGLWNGIGGRVEEGHDPSETMVNKFAKKTGVAQMEIVWQSFMTLVTKTNDLVHYFSSFTDQVELVSTVTDELVSIHHVSVLPAMVDRLVSDVPWQIAMSLSMGAEQTGLKTLGVEGRRQSVQYIVSEFSPVWLQQEEKMHKK